jgi:hypothetical protein
VTGCNSGLRIFVERLKFHSSAYLRVKSSRVGSDMWARSLRIAVVSFAGLALTMAWGPQRARAEIVENIFLEGTSDLLGSVSFPSASGAGVAGVDLSYGSFTTADITSASWTLDPSTFAVLSLDLSAALGSCSPASAPCSGTILQLSPDLAEPGNVSCLAGVPFCLVAIQQIPVSYVVPVPEASTWAMMLIGFAGLGYAGYRRTRKPVSIAA